MAPPSLPRRGSESGCLQRHHEEANSENRPAESGASRGRDHVAAV